MKKAICPGSSQVKLSDWFGVLIVLLLWPSLASAQTDHLFTGQELDAASRLYYYGQRYYNPSLGRFTQPDPLQKLLATPELEAKTGLTLEEVLSNPQRLNAYSYALNNPVNVTDPTGAVSKERQERFDQISHFIRNDDSYWEIRDRDGNAPALDAIWHKCLELSQNKDGEADIGSALDTFYDAVHIDWAHDKTLDQSREDYIQRRDNLPSSLGGEYGGNRSQQDKLQHFAASARLAWKYGGRVAGLLGRLKEIHDGFKAVLDSDYSYNEMREMGGGYSGDDITANQVGIFWVNELKAGNADPSDIINN